MIGRACALTGHRDLPPDFSEDGLLFALSDLLDEGANTFYCGMARGFDLAALNALSVLKRERNFVVEACIPYAGQEAGFPPRERELYRSLLDICDRKTVLFPFYKNGCLLARDRYMVDRCDIVFAYCTRATGGTAYTVKYARRQGVEVRLYP